MNDRDARELVVEALVQSSVHSLRDKGYADDFLAGRRDVPLGELDMDSLAVMEICIAIEAQTSIELLPQRVLRFDSLGKLARWVGERA